MKPASTHILPVHPHEGIRPCDAKRKMRSSWQLFRACWLSSEEHTITSLSGITRLLPGAQHLWFWPIHKALPLVCGCASFCSLAHFSTLRICTFLSSHAHIFLYLCSFSHSFFCAWTRFSVFAHVIVTTPRWVLVYFHCLTIFLRICNIVVHAHIFLTALRFYCALACGAAMTIQCSMIDQLL